MRTVFCTTPPLLAALLSLASLAHAAPTADQTQRAKEAYANGERAASEKHWADAARAFALADELAANDTALDSAIEAARRADDAVLAMNLAERAQRSATTRSLPSVAAARKAFSARTAAIELDCVKEQPACVARIDDALALVARTWVTPGGHTVRFDEPTSPKIVVDAKAGTTTPVAPAPPPKIETAPEAPPKSDAPESHGISGWWIALPAGATVVAGAITAGFGATYSSSQSDYEDARGVAPVAEQQKLIDETEAWQDRTNVAIALTAITAAATAAVIVTVLVVNGSDDEPSSTVEVSPSADGATARWTVRF